MNGPTQQTNILAMFQRNPNCYYPGVRIDFTEIKDHSESTAKGENVFKKIIPSYNNDGLHFTDAFVLESEKTQKTNPNGNIQQNLNLNMFKVKFQSRIQKQNENMHIQQLYSAEPESFFCQICRSQFQNYHQHIKDRNHTKNLEFSKGHKFIKQICKQTKKYLKQEQMNNEPQPTKGVKKVKQIRQKKIVSMNSKKNKQVSLKIGQAVHNIQNVETKCCQHDQTEGSKRERNENFAIIINKQMNLSSVEKPNLQNIN